MKTTSGKEIFPDPGHSATVCPVIPAGEPISAPIDPHPLETFIHGQTDPQMNVALDIYLLNGKKPRFVHLPNQFIGRNV